MKKTNAGMPSASGVYITCNANAPTIKIDNPKLDSPAKAETINNSEPKISNTPTVIRNYPLNDALLNAWLFFPIEIKVSLATAARSNPEHMLNWIKFSKEYGSPTAN